MALERIRKEVAKIWDHSPEATTCFLLLEYLEKVPVSQLQFLTFKTLISAAGRDEVDHELIAAINILTSSKLGLLEAHALFVDENEEEYELTGTELEQALQFGELAHPESGELVSNFQERIFPYFAATERLKVELA